MVQRLWHVISDSVVSQGRPALRIQDFDNIKSLLIGIASLIDVFEVRRV